MVTAAIVGLGVMAAALWYRAGRAAEQERIQTEIDRRIGVRHQLVREVLNRYEDSLFGLSALFMSNANVSRMDFVRATTRLEQRIKGAQAFEWVPEVAHQDRANMEAVLQRTYARRVFEFFEFDAAGGVRRAADRPTYYPIVYIQPMRGNERALGFDLMSGPTRGFLELAKERRQMVVTSQLRLVQETGNQLGVVLIWPVYRLGRPASPQTGETFAGFLQCVFRVHDMLEIARPLQRDGILDMLFIDASETDPGRRLLYYRPADDDARREPAPTEAEFRAGGADEQRLRFGGRDWRVLFRPRAGWRESQHSSTPLVRSIGIVLFSALLAGLVQIVARRTEMIRQEVEERTAQLAESRRQLASTLHSLPGMAYRATYDDQMTVVFMSEGALELTGWTADEFMSGVAHYRDCIHPDDLTRVREATRAALHDRQDIELEYRLRTKSGAEKWVLSRGHGVYSQEGRLDVFEGLVIDITAQRAAEDARLGLERKLLEGQKLESLGLLAGGIAHDFNNLLSSILGNANLARSALPPPALGEHHLRAIENASLRAAELCRQMLAYAGKGRFVIEPADLTALAEDLLPLLKVTVGRNATLQLDLARDLPAVMADATQLRQIVMNLVLNAADAIGDRRGEILLTTGVDRVDAAFLATCVAGAGLPGGDYVFLEVRDTGCGMSPAVLAKIFDPFFTTKFAGRGLGLAAVLGIVRGHKGALCVSSTEGIGSSFRLFLPPGPAAPQKARPLPAPAAERWTHAGRVLLVDDEEPVRFVMGEMLRTFGLTVETAADGEAGLKAFRGAAAPFDFVILDLLMPGLNGEQTLLALREHKAEVAVLLISGYNEGDVLNRLRGAGPLAFLAKPFTRDALERKLRELLGEPVKSLA